MYYIGKTKNFCKRKRKLLFSPLFRANGISELKLDAEIVITLRYNAGFLKNAFGVNAKWKIRLKYK